MLKGLDKLAKRIEHSRKALDHSGLERQIARLLGRNRRAAGRYHIQLVADPALPAKLRLRWAVNKHWDERTRQHEGCYILRTNVTDWTPETMWRTYIQLWEKDQAVLLDRLGLRLPERLKVPAALAEM